mmetsp:Transcript_116236/g.292255  ORF Transcript_116236/g.292255 Transcript_116236/m.292255 type:complete len:971 (+) Transcript_116236:101-3013(+)
MLWTPSGKVVASAAVASADGRCKIARQLGRRCIIASQPYFQLCRGVVDPATNTCLNQTRLGMFATKGALVAMPDLGLGYQRASASLSVGRTSEAFISVLLQFFDKMDAGGEGRVHFSELEAGLDTLSSRMPSYYTVAVALKQALIQQDSEVVERAFWISACTRVVSQPLHQSASRTPTTSTSIGFAADLLGSQRTMSALLPDLTRAVETLDRDKVQRRAQQRHLFGNSLTQPQLGGLDGARIARWSMIGTAEETRGGGSGVPSTVLQADSPSDGTLTHAHMEEAHRKLLLRFFENLDADKDALVDHGELEVGLDSLFSRAPSYYELTSILLLAVGGREDVAVHLDDWMKACDVALKEMLITLEPRFVKQAGSMEDAHSQFTAMLTELEKAVDALDQARVRRRAKRRMIYGRSLDVPTLGEEEFPKQRIEGVSTKKLQMSGLRRFESCLEGYSFVNATLGFGAFAKVFLVRNDSTGDIQAMKRIDRQAMQRACNLSEEDVLRRVEHEFRHLQHTDHPHIIKLFEFRQDSRYSYFVMEAANGGDLRQVVDHAYGRIRPPKGKVGLTGSCESSRKLSEIYVSIVLEQTAYALYDLHREGRIHKDIKLENLMLLSRELPPHVVLIDLGFMEMLPEEQAEETLMPAGTPHTMAPEVIETYLGVRPSGFDERCDIYSLGVVLFEMLVGRPPYEPVYTSPRGPKSDIDYKATLDLIHALDVDLPLREAGRSDGIVDLVRKMLAVDPVQRPSALGCLRHDWSVRHGARRQARSSLGAQVAVSDVVVPSAEAVRRQSISAQARSFARRSALQRGAAYHLAAQIPVIGLRQVGEHLARVGQTLGGEINREELSTTLQNILGVDEACARYVAAQLDAEDSIPEDFEEFASACVVLCAEREAVLVRHVVEAIVAAGERGLSLGEALGALERAAVGRIRRTEVTEWLRASLISPPSPYGPLDDSLLLSKEAVEQLLDGSDVGQ